MEKISYVDYLSYKDALSFDYCQEIHQAILKGLRNDEEMIKTWNEFLETSMNYAYTRSQWLLWERSERQSKDETRTIQHEKVIYNITLLSRYMERAGQDVSWFKELEGNRKRIGDFASYIAYVYAVNAR